MIVAEHFVGLPFKVNGRGPGGYDCWGLVREVLERLFNVERLPSYEHCTDVAEAIAQAQAHVPCERVEVPKAGDVVVMMTPVGDGESAPLHVGVMINDRQVLHVDRGELSTCLDLDHPSISPRLSHFLRHAQLA
jgi:cell wall-associated NlpC family hydrolase